VYPLRHGLWYSNNSVRSFAGSMLEKDNDARLVEEEASHEVVAHTPSFSELVDRVMPFERRFLG
jgi:hypothetical protein